jgi:probable rRNA maturation factor
VSRVAPAAIPANAAMTSIEISNCQTALQVDAARLKRAAESILRDAGVTEARLSIAVVDDPAIHQLNRQFLKHDEPTDVLSFLLERDGERLEGEIVVSAETAIRVAEGLDWSGGDELLLYVIHGTLHLVGHDDAAPAQRAAMQSREAHYLAEFGLTRQGEDAVPNERADKA